MTFSNRVVFILYFINLCNSQNPPLTSDNETKLHMEDLKRLYAQLINGVNTLIRPRHNQYHIVEVNTTFIPTNIINLDTTGGQLDVAAYFKVSWKDELLTWKPEEYSGTNKIKIPIRNIWKPTLTLAKAFNGPNLIGNAMIDTAILSFEGIVQWVPDGIYSFMCDVNVEWYPFDIQTCRLTYFVDDETISTVTLYGPESVSTNEYAENSEWHLLELSTKRDVMSDMYMVHVDFKLERRAQFTAYTLVLPLMMLSSINVFVFLMPIGSGEKASTSITVFLAYGVLTTMIRDTLPHNSLNTSYFVVYIVVLLTVSILTVMYVVIQAKLFNERGNQPCWLCCYVSTKVDAVIKFSNNSETAVGEDENVRVVTWTMFLNKLDNIIFVLFFFVVFLTTVSFGCMVNSNNT